MKEEKVKPKSTKTVKKVSKKPPEKKVKAVVVEEEKIPVTMRAPFLKNQIGKLPKQTRDQKDNLKANRNLGIACPDCGQWHHKDTIHLDYVGHAALTDRLLDVDPAWNWVPLAFDPAGLPLFDKLGGLWAKLTVLSKTVICYGNAPMKKNQDPGAREKEVIGDMLRNGGMRLGAALDLWHKGDLHVNLEDAKKEEADAKLKEEKLAEIEEKKADAKKLQDKLENDYKVLMEVILGDIENITDSESANDFVSLIDKNYTHTRNSRPIASSALQRKAKSLGLIMGQDKKYTNKEKSWKADFERCKSLKAFDEVKLEFIKSKGDKILDEIVELGSSNKTTWESFLYDLEVKFVQVRFEQMCKDCTDSSALYAIEKTLEDYPEINTEKNQERILIKKNDLATKKGTE